MVETSGLLIKGVSKTIENETKEQTARYLGMLLDILCAILFGNLSAGKKVITAGQEF